MIEELKCKWKYKYKYKYKYSQVENKKKQLMIDELSRRGYDSDPVKAWKKSQVHF